MTNFQGCTDIKNYKLNKQLNQQWFNNIVKLHTVHYNFEMRNSLIEL